MKNTMRTSTNRYLTDLTSTRIRGQFPPYFGLLGSYREHGKNQGVLSEGLGFLLRSIMPTISKNYVPLASRCLTCLRVYVSKQNRQLLQTHIQSLHEMNSQIKRRIT